MLIKITQNDRLYALDFDLQEDDGLPVDVTNATILFKAQKLRSQTLLSVPMTIVDATNGKVRYTVLSGNFAESGTYDAEIEVTWPSGQIRTWSGISVEVAAELPKQVS